MTRPVAQKVWNGSTSTGISDWAVFGTGMRFVTAWIAHGTTEAITASVEVTAGASTSEAAVLASAASTGDTQRTSTGGIVFDKARINVSANGTTGDLTVIISAAP